MYRLFLCRTCVLQAPPSVTPDSLCSLAQPGPGQDAWVPAPQVRPQLALSTHAHTSNADIALPRTARPILRGHSTLHTEPCFHSSRLPVTGVLQPTPRCSLRFAGSQLHVIPAILRRSSSPLRWVAKTVDEEPQYEAEGHTDECPNAFHHTKSPPLLAMQRLGQVSFRSCTFSGSTGPYPYTHNCW